MDKNFQNMCVVYLDIFYYIYIYIYIYIYTHLWDGNLVCYFLSARVISYVHALLMHVRGVSSIRLLVQALFLLWSLPQALFSSGKRPVPDLLNMSRSRNLCFYEF